VRRRLDGICAAAGLGLADLDVQVITAPTVRLDLAADRRSLDATVAEWHPRLLVLDPFVRLHRIDENASGEVAPLLAYLRELQRDEQRDLQSVIFREITFYGRVNRGMDHALDVFPVLLGKRRSCSHLVRLAPSARLIREAPALHGFCVELCLHGGALLGKLCLQFLLSRPFELMTFLLSRPFALFRLSAARFSPRPGPSSTPPYTPFALIPETRARIRTNSGARSQRAYANMILAGHGRVEAARLEGFSAVPVIRFDHLTDAQKRAYVIADNKIAEQG
jgi:hypothetical protein